MKRIVTVLMIMMAVAACENNNYYSPIPNAPVSLQFDILRDAPNLIVIGGYQEFETPKKPYQYLGFGGILVFNTFEDKLVAFDMSCPNEVSRQVRVHVKGIDGTVTCEKCGSVYDIGFGTGFNKSGPSQHPLKAYEVLRAGYSVRIVN